MLNISKGKWLTLKTNVDTEHEAWAVVNESGAYIAAVEKEHDLELIAESGNVAQECGLMPRELLEERDRIRKQLEAYKEVFEEYIPTDKMDEANNKILDLCDEAAQAMGKRFCG